MNVIETRPSVAARLREFVDVYSAYRVANGRTYAARIAFGIAFRGIPF